MDTVRFCNRCYRITERLVTQQKATGRVDDLTKTLRRLCGKCSKKFSNSFLET